MAVEPRKRGPYKRYLRDPTLPIPKQTLCNWRQKGIIVDNDPANEPLVTQNDYIESQDSEPEIEVPFSSPTTTPPFSPSVASADGEPTAASPASFESPTPTSSDAHLTENLLYPGAQISEETGRLLIQSLTMRHGLTKAALADILQLVRLHLPPGCVPASYKSVHRYSESMNLISSAVEHKICMDCGEMIDSIVVAGGCLHSDLVSFYELPLDTQIQAMFLGKVCV